MKKYFWHRQPFAVFLFVFFSLFGIQSVANACGCCAEDGQRFEYTQALGADEIQLLSGIQISNAVRVFVTAAGFDGIKGITSPAENYRLAVTRDDRRWRWTFTDTAGNSGVLAFNLPDAATSFGTDLRDGLKADAGGPLLYKEWRMRGRVWGNGIFAAGMSGEPQFHLILHGRGIGCLSAEDWQYWRLEIEGARAAFVLFGDLPTTRAAIAAQPLYFSTPQSSIPVITELLRKEDWRTLSRYYDLSGTDMERSELESGRFFLRTERPANAHPAGLWRYKHPFAPGYKFQSAEDVAQLATVQVTVMIEIEQGDGTTQRGMSDFLMRKHEAGYQILPPFSPGKSGE